MTDPADLSSRVTEVEIQLAHVQHAFDELNGVVTEQSLLIDRLRRQIDSFKSELKQLKQRTNRPTIRWTKNHRITNQAIANPYSPNGDMHTMKRVFSLICFACIIGCSQSENSPATTSGAQDVTTPTIKHGRVTLLTYKIEAGAPNESAIESGLDTATSVLNDLLETEELKPTTGTFVGRFRLETDGTVRMFLTDKSTSIANGDGSKLTEAFVKAAFGGKCSFPELSDMAMLYAEFKIEPPQ